MGFFAKRRAKSERTVLQDSRHAIELDRYSAPEKIVIVSAHPFGAALKYLLLGAIAGAGATYFALKGRGVATSTKDAVAEGLSAGGAKSQRDLLGRALALSGRVKSVAGAVGRVKEFAGDTLGPAVAAAVSEGKRTVREVEAELKQDLEESKREAEAEAKEAQAEREKSDKDDKKHNEH